MYLSFVPLENPVVVQFEFSHLAKPFTKRHLDGRKASPSCHQRASCPERPFVLLLAIKYKVPHPYSRAGKNARLRGFGMTIFGFAQTVPLPENPGLFAGPDFGLKHAWADGFGAERQVADSCPRVPLYLEQRTWCSRHPEALD